MTALEARLTEVLAREWWINESGLDASHSESDRERAERAWVVCEERAEYECRASNVMRDLAAEVAAHDEQARAEVLERIDPAWVDGELADLQSFVWVETRHEPTRASVAELRVHLRAALAPTAPQTVIADDVSLWVHTLNEAVHAATPATAPQTEGDRP